MTDVGPLTRIVLDYVAAMEQLVPSVRSPEDWASLAEFVAIDRFERVGTFLEVQDWAQYTGMLTQWASTIDSFATSVRRIAEVDDRVYYEVEERHVRGDAVHTVNSMTVFEFGRDARIRHLDVYLQQAR